MEFNGNEVNRRGVRQVGGAGNVYYEKHVSSLVASSYSARDKVQQNVRFFFCLLN